MVWRISLTVLALVLYGTIHYDIPLLGLGESALHQFDNSDSSYINTQLMFRSYHWLSTVSFLALWGLVGFIWAKPVMRAWQKLNKPTKSLLILAALLPLLAINSAHAYYSSTDYAEVFTVYPNETIFWIPDAGGNLDSQGKMDSAEYYDKNKVALKRFQIPHQKLANSGWAVNMVVPAGRLIVVERTPYTAEWTRSATRGTQKVDEAIYCQDKKGLDVITEVSINASIEEVDAAKYLYHFGVLPPEGDRNTPEVVFTSVYHARHLPTVMNTIVRTEIHNQICNAVMALDLEQVNEQAGKIMTDVTKSVKKWLEPYGITIDAMGWAGTFDFDPKVQDAINRRFIAVQDKAIAEALAPQADTIQKLSAAFAMRSFGEHTDGKFPTTSVGLPSNALDLIQTLLGSHFPTTPAPASK
jgi:SPFH domain / Band 7 family